MTFKQLFAQANFSIIHDADFCIIVSNNLNKYLLYRYSPEMCCYALDFFQDVTIKDLMFFYDIKEDDHTEEIEEYVFENIVSKEKVLSYIFSLIELNEGDKAIRHPFKKDVYAINESDEFALVLKSTDKKPKTTNILAFSKKGYHTLYTNSNCNWKSGGEEGQEKVLISWNPYLLHTFLTKSKESYLSYILVKNCGNNSLKSPMLSKATKEYNIICSTLDDSVEAMRFVIALINTTAGTSLNFHHCSTMIEVEIPLAPDEELTHWIQLFSNVMKKIRQVYYESLSTNFDFIKQQKQTVQGKEYLYLSFVKVQPLIAILCRTFIVEYKLKVNIINAFLIK